MVNVFRFTIDDCEIVMNVTKKYIENKLCKPDNSINQEIFINQEKFMNYGLFLHLYNNRDSCTLLALLQLLEEFNTREYLFEGVFKTTALTCFYNKYVKNIGGKGYSKKVTDIEKEKEYCDGVFEYILSSGCVYKMRYGYAYEKFLRYRLDKLKEMKFEETFVGLDEVGLSCLTIKKLNNLGYFTLSDLLKKFYKMEDRQEKRDDYFNNVFQKLLKYDILSEKYNKEKALNGEIFMETPFRFLYCLFGKDSDIIKDLYLGPNSKDIYMKLIFVALDKLTPRERIIIIDRFGLESGNPMLLQDVGQKYCVTRERIRLIEEKALRKLRHPSHCSIFKKENVLKLIK